MNSIDLFTSALGLSSPWRVDDVRFDPDQGEIHFDVVCGAAFVNEIVRFVRFVEKLISLSMTGNPAPGSIFTFSSTRHSSMLHSLVLPVVVERPHKLRCPEPTPVVASPCCLKLLPSPWPNSFLFDRLHIFWG